MSIARELHMVYGLENGKSINHVLKNPKNTISTATVESVMQSAITNNVIKNGPDLATDIKDVYIKQVERNF